MRLLFRMKAWSYRMKHHLLPGIGYPNHRDHLPNSICGFWRSPKTYHQHFAAAKNILIGPHGWPHFVMVCKNSTLSQWGSDFVDAGFRSSSREPSWASLFGPGAHVDPWYCRFCRLHSLRDKCCTRKCSRSPTALDAHGPRKAHKVIAYPNSSIPCYFAPPAEIIINIVLAAEKTCREWANDSGIGGWGRSSLKGILSLRRLVNWCGLSLKLQVHLVSHYLAVPTSPEVLAMEPMI